MIQKRLQERAAPRLIVSLCLAVILGLLASACISARGARLVTEYYDSLVEVQVQVREFARRLDQATGAPITREALEAGCAPARDTGTWMLLAEDPGGPMSGVWLEIARAQQHLQQACGELTVLVQHKDGFTGPLHRDRAAQISSNLERACEALTAAGLELGAGDPRC